MLAWWNGEAFVDSIEFDLVGTPCDIVISQGKTCFYAKGLQTLFPREAGRENYLGIPIFDAEGRVIGHLASTGTLPMDDPLPHESIFNVCAARAGIEMENSALPEQLYEAMARVARPSEALLPCILEGRHQCNA